MIALYVAVVIGPGLLILTVPILVQRWLWHREDRRWDRAVDRWAEAASRGVDTTWLKDCPDIGRALGH